MELLRSVILRAPLRPPRQPPWSKFRTLGVYRCRRAEIVSRSRSSIDQLLVVLLKPDNKAIHRKQPSGPHQSIRPHLEPQVLVLQKSDNRSSKCLGRAFPDE